MVLTVSFISGFKIALIQARQSGDFLCCMSHVAWLLNIHSAYIMCIDIQMFS